MIDLHVHTWRCRHATGTAGEYVLAAAAAGIRTLCFTEHLPLAPALAAAVPGAESYAMPADEFGAYLADVAEAAAPGAGLGVEVLCGIEADLVAPAVEHARDMVGRHRFDVVLGSVHFIDGWAFDDPGRQEGYAAWDTLALWERYFADLVAAARTGIADVMAHVDLVKKFCHRPETGLEGLYAEVAAELARTGVAVEVNTGGLRKPCREIYPGPDMLAALASAGVPVTIGTDAHAPVEVGAGLPEALTALRAVGYRSVLVFRDRVAEEVSLDELDAAV